MTLRRLLWEIQRRWRGQARFRPVAVSAFSLPNRIYDAFGLHGDEGYAFGRRLVECGLVVVG